MKSPLTLTSIAYIHAVMGASSGALNPNAEADDGMNAFGDLTTRTWHVTEHFLFVDSIHLHIGV
jgi:hypothetical protein